MATDSEVKPVLMVTSFNEESIQKYIQKLDKIESQYSSAQPIIIQIDSYGGFVHGLSVLYDKIKSIDNPIVTYTASKAMSAGAILLSTVASEGMRFASPEADIMVHEIQSGNRGDIKDIEDDTAYVKVMNKKWMTLLAKSMGLKNHTCIRNLIREQAIGHNVHLTARKAKSLGVIDEVASIKLTPYYGWDVKKIIR